MTWVSHTNIECIHFLFSTTNKQTIFTYYVWVIYMIYTWSLCVLREAKTNTIQGISLNLDKYIPFIFSSTNDTMENHIFQQPNLFLISLDRRCSGSRERIYKNLKTNRKFDFNCYQNNIKIILILWKQVTQTRWCASKIPHLMEYKHITKTYQLDENTTLYINTWEHFMLQSERYIPFWGHFILIIKLVSGTFESRFNWIAAPSMNKAINVI